MSARDVPEHQALENATNAAAEIQADTLLSRRTAAHGILQAK